MQEMQVGSLGQEDPLEEDMGNPEYRLACAPAGESAFGSGRGVLNLGSGSSAKEELTLTS